MKNPFLLFLFLMIEFLDPAHAQHFQNLDFELANTNRLILDSPNTPVSGRGSTEDLMPFWQVNIGSVRLDTIGVNTTLGFVPEPVDLLTGRLFVTASGYSVTAIGPNENTGWKETIFFIQRAEVPQDAIRLSYDFALWSLGVLVNGKSVFAAEIPAIVNPNLNVPMTAHYDVSAYAGQTVELALFTQGYYSSFDNIRFSDVPFIIPEPSVFALGTFAGLLWFLARAGSIRRRPTTGSRIKTGV